MSITIRLILIDIQMQHDENIQKKISVSILTIIRHSFSVYMIDKDGEKKEKFDGWMSSADFVYYIEYFTLFYAWKHCDTIASDK